MMLIWENVLKSASDWKIAEGVWISKFAQESKEAKTSLDELIQAAKFPEESNEAKRRDELIIQAAKVM